MSITEAIIQGVIQGLTEFLPVSSSGHLSLYQHFTGNSGEGSLLFSAVLHMGTLLAVFTAFHSLIWDMVKEFLQMIKKIFTGKFRFKELSAEGRGVIMMMISLLMLFPFYIFRDVFENVAQDNDIIIEGICFIYTSVILFMTDKYSDGSKKLGDVTVKNAVTVGLFQGLALLPGISRSGSTIAGGTFCGFDRKTAVEYSFILGIPAILGGSILEGKQALTSGVEIEPLNFAVGMVTAAVVGIMAIKLVNIIAAGSRFRIFGVYTLLLGISAVGMGIYERLC